jgi:hypothetical protein
MKTGFAIGIVFCLAVTAGAALQLDVTDGKVKVIGKMEVDMFLGLSACEGATLSNFEIGPAAPSIIRDPDLIGIPDPFPIEFPDGCFGKWKFFGVFPGEDYKEGIYWTADVTPAVNRVTSNREEILPCPYRPGQWFIRTYTDTVETQKGSVLLQFIDPDFTEVAVIDWVSLDKQTITTTYVDTTCLPEPATLALLGLGIALIRRRNSIK